MKKYIAFFLASLILFSLSACAMQKDTPPEASYGTSSQMPREPALEDIPSLIENGDYETAYKLLYAAKDDPENAEMLKDFKVCVAKETQYNVSGKPFQITEFQYDGKGNLVYTLTEFPAEDKTTESFRTYNEMGQLTEYRYKSRSEDSEGDDYDNVEKTTYDEKGNKIKIETTDSHGDWSTTKFTYDERNNLLVHHFDSSAYDSFYMFTMTYNEDDQMLTEHRNYGISEEYYEYTYNDAGLLVFEKSIVNEEENFWATEYTHDSRGNIIKKITTDMDGDVSIEETTYDEKGNKLTRTVTNDGGICIDEKYTYNADGLLTRFEKLYDDDATLETYEYDESGNLIKYKYARTSPSGNRNFEETYTYDDCDNLIEQKRTATAGYSCIETEYTYIYCGA